jgi:hypothetical protein
MVRSTLCLVLLACCGDNPKTPDAAPQNFEFTGEYVDWDSTSANFCGIFGATWTDHTNASVTDTTNPNGRFDMQMGGADTRVDITAPTDPSQCLMPINTQTYDNPGIVVVDQGLVGKGIIYSTRSFSTTRRDSFFTGLGLTYDATKAQVFVNVQGTATSPAITATHAASAAFDGGTWAAGGQGVYVFFPNVDPSAGTTTLTATGATGSQTLPLVAGTITYAAVSN